MDIEFKKRLLATFKIETKEHLDAISAGLIILEKDAEQGKRREIVEVVFREAHSLKGAARAVGMTGIESLSHALESVFAMCKRRNSAPSRDLFDLLHRAVDTIGMHLSSAGTGIDDSLRSTTREIVLGLEKAAKDSATTPPQVTVPPPPMGLGEGEVESGSAVYPASSDSIRISAVKLDSVMRRAEEMLTAKLTARQRAVELGEISAELASWEKEWKKVRPVLGRLRKVRQGSLSADLDAGHLDKVLDFFDTSHGLIKSLQNRTNMLSKSAAANRNSLGGMVDGLLDELTEALMLPCSAVLEVLPKMARDLARDRGKEAALFISGETVEIDRRVLEQLKDPIIHLIRNCIDHGIEKPEERMRANKPARGKISVNISLMDANRVEFLVSDDGAGIDTVRVADEAVRRGIATRDECDGMGSGELIEMLYRSGFSTSSLVTDISGRGLGLAIVREKVERLGGTVMVESEPLKGTSFRMVIPLTLSTYRGVLVRAAEQTFVVPAAGVERVMRIDSALLKTVENRETVELDGAAVSFIRLADVLQLRKEKKNADNAGLIQLLVIASGASRMAFGVDGIIGEREILVKSLGPQLARVRNFSGATVLGTGQVALILHPGDLVKSAVKVAGIPAGAVSARETAKLTETARKSVLITEDSITARALLKNILETAGYQTYTAVDGIDALTLLRTEHIDLVVSDVDMPRMNGFDLTARIRASRDFADLPVVLVTSLDSREDRERGIEAGANAYVVKSSFDQSNLLQVIKRLI
jgi:two-component system chemotaxis sensor kinase CheA